MQKRGLTFVNQTGTSEHASVCAELCPHRILGALGEPEDTHRRCKEELLGEGTREQDILGLKQEDKIVTVHHGK